MASLVSGLFDLFSGDPAKKEENQFGSLSGYDTGVGESLVTPGAQFEESILSGDPTKIGQALAPEISTGQQQAEQAKNTAAQFDTRSGGTASYANNIDTANRANLINLVGGLQSGTAASAVGQGTSLIGQGGEFLGNEADLAEKRRAQLNQDVAGIASGAASIAAPFIGGASAAPDPYESLYNAQQPTDLQTTQPDVSAQVEDVGGSTL